MLSLVASAHRFGSQADITILQSDLGQVPLKFPPKAGSMYVPGNWRTQYHLKSGYCLPYLPQQTYLIFLL